MTDYASFVSGATQYPLPAEDSGIGGTGASLLRDCDPVSFYLLEFYKKVLELHIGTRFLYEAGVATTDLITQTVAETLPLNPEPFLTEEQIKFPLLAIYRKGTKFEYHGQTKHSTDTFEVAYVLPPLQAGEAERLLPILKAVVGVLDNRTEQGFDPLYTPTTPTGTAGELVWERAGIAKAGITSATYGSYAPTNDLTFPAVIMTLEVAEKSATAFAEFQLYDGVDVAEDLASKTEPTVTNVVQFSTYPAPTLTVASPNSGTKSGGTTVTLTGTNFHVGTTPTIKFGGVAATGVLVLSATSVQCVTPAHDAFPTYLADVVITNIDGQSGTLTAGYTFT